MVSSREFHPRQLQTSRSASACKQGMAAARSPGKTDMGARGARVCIVPLQGSRCYSPHSGQDPGVRSRGGQEGPCECRRPHTSTDLPWLLQKHACRRSSPSATPPQGEDTINCRHRTHQGARLSLSKLLYMFPRGKEAQGGVGTDLWASAW